MSNNASTVSQVTSQIPVTATSTVNDRGVVRHAGNAASSGNLTNKTPGEVVRDFTTRVIANTQVSKALTAGTLAYRAGHLIRRVTASISGVANTVLRSGCSDYGDMRSIHKLEATRFSFLSGRSWSVSADGDVRYTDTVGAGGANGGWWSISGNADGTSSTDDAATPTRAIPGELVYKSMKNAPVTADYTKKTGN